MIAADTNILVWGIRKSAPKERPDLVDRCLQLLQDQRALKSPILVPSIVLAEFLIGHTLEQQKRVRQIFGKHYYVAPFDAKAAAIAAELFDKKQFDQIKSENGVPRQCLKADYKIIATAIAHGASSIYVDDRHFEKIASDRILVKGVPELKASSDDLPPPSPSPSSGDSQRDLSFGDDE